MHIQQISVFVENKPGRMAEITETISAAAVDIRAMSIADTSDFGILRVIVNQPEKAAEVLRAAGFTVSITSVIAIGIDDAVGEFSRALRLLADNRITVEYMYAFVSKEHGKASIILRVDDDDHAAQVLAQHGISILSDKEVYNM